MTSVVNGNIHEEKTLKEKGEDEEAVESDVLHEVENLSDNSKETVINDKNPALQTNLDSKLLEKETNSLKDITDYNVCSSNLSDNSDELVINDTSPNSQANLNTNILEKETNLEKNISDCHDLNMEIDESPSKLSCVEKESAFIKPVENGMHSSDKMLNNLSVNTENQECDALNNIDSLQKLNVTSPDSTTSDLNNDSFKENSEGSKTNLEENPDKSEISIIEEVAQNKNNCEEDENDTKSEIGKDSSLSDLDTSSSLLCDTPSQAKDCNNSLCLDKPDTLTENKITSSTANVSLDLSISKNKESEISLINGETKHVEPNPLQKLNEHLNSIGCDVNAKTLPPKDPNVPSLPKNTILSNNKENKNVPSQSHDRFKESPENFVFAELSNKETGFPDIFTGHVKIGRYISVKGDFTLRSTEALVESPSLVSSYLLKEPDTFPQKEKDSKSEPKDFFHSTAGEILIGIGLSRVNEWFHKDMVRVKKRQLKNAKTEASKKPQLEEELSTHEKLFTEAKKANSVYSFKYSVCPICGFTTESSNVMEGHKLVPHVTSRREYQCNFCDKIDRDPKAILQHMEEEHNKIGRIQPPVLFFECPYCSYDSNSKVKLNNHLIKCQRYFDHGVNQAPPRDFEFPALTPKPITVAVVKAYEKSVGTMQRGRGRPKKHDSVDSMLMNKYTPILSHPPNTPKNIMNYRSNSTSPLIETLTVQNPLMTPMQMPNMGIRPTNPISITSTRPGLTTLSLASPNRFYQIVNSAGQVVPIVGNNIASSVSQFPFPTNTVNNSGKKISSSASPFMNAPVVNSGLRQATSKVLPEMSITALPKLTGPYPSPLAKPGTQPNAMAPASKPSIVCEICDGFIQDLDQLRTHMQLIHKVKIHPKMLVSRPPLNCQKCHWRFFTDQGLERHLLGAHGLVTSNMQELANKNKDAGCCTICGRVYASKLVGHMNQIHKVTLKPAHLSYKCTVCSATFNLYRLFENHVYLVHSGAAKRSSEGGRSSPTKKLKTNSDKGDSFVDSGVKNHPEKIPQVVEDEVRICMECGDDILSDKPNIKKCEKCLKSDELLHGTMSTKLLREELRKKQDC